MTTCEDLLLKKEKLKEENKNLKLEYEEKLKNSKINDTLALINVDHGYRGNGYRGGRFRHLIKHPEYRTKWKGSFYDNYRPFIQTLKAHTLRCVKLFEEGNINSPFGNPYSERLGSLFGYCDMVAPSKYGPIIRITDPFGSYTFPPFKNATFEEASKWAGRIIIVDALFKYGRKTPIVTDVKVLPFTLYEDLRNNY